MKKTPQHVKQAGESLHELHQDAEMRRVKHPGAVGHISVREVEDILSGNAVKKLMIDNWEIDIGKLGGPGKYHLYSERTSIDGDAPAYGIIDPDYARIFTKARCIAWTYGYAAVMHGSFTRDLDILLVPWGEHATDDPQRIIDMVCESCGLRPHRSPPTAKPHGRTSYTLLFPEFGDPRFVDISIVPKVAPPVQGAGSYTASDIANAFSRAGISDSLFEDVRIELESAK